MLSYESKDIFIQFLLHYIYIFSVAILESVSRARL